MKNMKNILIIIAIICIIITLTLIFKNLNLYNNPKSIERFSNINIVGTPRINTIKKPFWYDERYYTLDFKSLIVGNYVIVEGLDMHHSDYAIKLLNSLKKLFELNGNYKYMFKFDLCSDGVSFENKYGDKEMRSGGYEDLYTMEIISNDGKYQPLGRVLEETSKRQCLVFRKELLESLNIRPDSIDKFSGTEKRKPFLYNTNIIWHDGGTRGDVSHGFYGDKKYYSYIHSDSNKVQGTIRRFNNLFFNFLKIPMYDGSQGNYEFLDVAKLKGEMSKSLGGTPIPFYYTLLPESNIIGKDTRNPPLIFKVFKNTKSDGRTTYKFFIERNLNKNHTYIRNNKTEFYIMGVESINSNADLKLYKVDEENLYNLTPQKLEQSTIYKLNNNLHFHNNEYPFFEFELKDKGLSVANANTPDYNMNLNDIGDDGSIGFKSVIGLSGSKLKHFNIDYNKNNLTQRFELELTQSMMEGEEADFEKTKCSILTDMNECKITDDCSVIYPNDYTELQKKEFKMSKDPFCIDRIKFENLCLGKDKKQCVGSCSWYNDYCLNNDLIPKEKPKPREIKIFPNKVEIRMEQNDNFYEVNKLISKLETLNDKLNETDKKRINDLLALVEKNHITVDKLNKELLDIEMSYKFDKQNVENFKNYKVVNSIQNGDELTAIPIDDNLFRLQINDKCLTVYGDKNYKLNNCDSRAHSQNFEIKEVKDYYDAHKHTGVNPNKKHTDVYPYSLIKSSIPPYNCLTVDNEGVSVQECNPNNSNQYWNMKNKVNECVEHR